MNEEIYAQAIYRFRQDTEGLHPKNSHIMYNILIFQYRGGTSQENYIYPNKFMLKERFRKMRACRIYFSQVPALLYQGFSSCLQFHVPLLLDLWKMFFLQVYAAFQLLIIAVSHVNLLSQPSCMSMNILYHQNIREE